MQKNITPEDEAKVLEIEKNISDECEEKEFEKLKKVVNDIEKNKTNVWKELKKAYPSKTKPIPTGVRNVIGRLVTNPSEKKVVTLQHFEHRMRKRPVMDDVEEIVNLKNDLFKVRLEGGQNQVRVHHSV